MILSINLLSQRGLKLANENANAQEEGDGVFVILGFASNVLAA